MRQITLRNIPDELAGRLAALKAEKKMSLNSLVIQILNKVLGVSERKKRLERYASWSPQDSAEFDEFLRVERAIDKNLWQ